MSASRPSARSPKRPPHVTPMVPAWFYMLVALIVTVTWAIYALTLGGDADRNAAFPYVTGIMAIVSTALFGASYIVRRNGK